MYPASRRSPARSVHGPFGEGEELLMAALVDWFPDRTLRAESPRPGLERQGGWWERPAPEIEPDRSVYSARNIQILDTAEAVRLRPGMYVGSSEGRGILHLAFELVGSALAAGPSQLRVDVDPRGITVSDDGDPWPVDQEPTLLERDPYRLHPTVHQAGDHLGIGVVTALSSVFVITLDRGRRYQQVFVRGVPTAPLLDTGPAQGRGTTVHLVPDAGIFGTSLLPLEALAKRLGELAILNSTLRITLNGRTVPSYGGVAGYARHLAGTPRSELLASGTHDGVSVELAVVWGDRKAVTFGFVEGLLAEGSHIAWGQFVAAPE